MTNKIEAVVHKNELARLKYESNKRRVIDAYNNRESAGDDFYIAVRDFASIKLHHLEIQFSQTGTYTTADDYAQEVVIAVWERLSTFQGDGEAFYHWVHRIAYTKAAQLFEELKDRKDNYVPLTVSVKESDSGEEEDWEVENPEITKSGYADNGIYFPEWATTLDLCILGLMTKEVYDPDRNNYKYGKVRSSAKDPDNPKGGYRGMNYREIAETLSISKAPPGDDWSKITEDVVKSRVKRLKSRVKREKAQGNEAAKKRGGTLTSQTRAKTGVG